MKVLISLMAGSALVFTSGCAAIRNELRHPAGQVGKLMDDRTFDASRSKDLQLIRAAMLIAIAARVGAGSVEAEDGGVFAGQLADAATELNYAAADAGFSPIGSDGGTCTIFDQAGNESSSNNQAADNAEDGAADPAWRLVTADDTDACTGYYVNFESHLQRIEGRVIRAMLTALPTDQAREFLDDISRGDLLSSLWSLLGAAGDLTLAFHRGAGIYRSTTELVAAGMPACYGDPGYPSAVNVGTFNETEHTILHAAACLGLSNQSLFDSDSATAEDFNVKFPVAAFHATLRMARASCVEIAIPNAGGFTDEDILTIRKELNDECQKLVFSPTMRPMAVEFDTPAEEESAADTEGAEGAGGEVVAEEGEQPPVVEPAEDGTEREVPVAS